MTRNQHDHKQINDLFHQLYLQSHPELRRRKNITGAIITFASSLVTFLCLAYWLWTVHHE